MDFLTEMTPEHERIAALLGDRCELWMHDRNWQCVDRGREAAVPEAQAQRDQLLQQLRIAE